MSTVQPRAPLAWQWKMVMVFFSVFVLSILVRKNIAPEAFFAFVTACAVAVLLELYQALTEPKQTNKGEQPKDPEPKKEGTPNGESH